MVIKLCCLIVYIRLCKDFIYYSVGDFDYGVGFIKLRPPVIHDTQAPVSSTLHAHFDPSGLLYQYLNTSSLTTHEMIQSLKYEFLNKYRKDLLSLKTVQEIRDWL